MLEMHSTKPAQAIEGVNPVILLESTCKRFTDASAGKGGLEALLQFLDKVDWIQDLGQLRVAIKDSTVFFESALSKCTKEMLKRPLDDRFEDIDNFLGMSCSTCSYGATYLELRRKSRMCPRCGQRMVPTLKLQYKKLRARNIEPTPEAMMMDLAYDVLADAYVAAYKAFKRAVENIATKFGWDRYRMDQRLLDYMDSYHYGRMAGEQKIAREEKEVLQLFVRAVLTGIPEDEAEQLIRLGVDVVKYGYIYEVLGIPGAKSLYRMIVPKYDALYTEMSAKIRQAIQANYRMPGVYKQKFKKIMGGYYMPMMIAPKISWISGQFTGEVILTPTARIDLSPRADSASIQAVYGRQGTGKTFLLSSIICYGIHSKRQVAFIPLNDKSNSYSLAFMPLFNYSRGTAKLPAMLTNILDIEPQGVPCITVTVLRKGEAVDNQVRHPPTIYDRLLVVEDPSYFHIDFNELLNELKEAAEPYGYSQPVGIIAFRNLQRQTQHEYIDVQVATNVLTEFDKWRKGNLNIPMRIVIDEISYIAGSQALTYARDKLMAGATISDFIKESRRNNVAVDAATQQPVEILPFLRNESTNVFFRDLALSKEKVRSQIDFLLESLQLRDETLKPIIRDMNIRGVLPKHFWFWWNQHKYDINVVRPLPPTFCIYDPESELSHLEIIRRYEKETGEKVLLDDWSKVKILKSSESLQPKKTERKSRVLGQEEAYIL